MLQLLIVDDEIHAVRGIKAGVEWERIGFSRVLEAFNIRQAKEICLTEKIDVMISDIEMPEGDGFELLAWVKEHSPATETLFLTCHADFAFAQKAIQLGSLDYMLKPVRFAELEIAVLKAISKLEKERELIRFNETYKHYYQLWEKYQPMFTERFWQDLIQRSIPSRKDLILEIIAKNNIPYSDITLFMPILISVQHWHKTLTLREKKIMEYALRNSLEELIVGKEQREGQLVQVKNGAILVILSVDPGEMIDEEQLSSELQSYIEACNQYFFCDICCYIGVPVYVEGMLDMFESLDKMESLNVTQTNKIFCLCEEESNYETILLPKMNGWAEMLKKGCKKALLEEVDQYLDAMKQMKRLDAKLLRGFYEDFLQMFYHVLHEKSLRTFEIFPDEILSVQASTATRSVADLRQWVNKLIEDSADHIHSVDESQTIVEKVKRYITQHIYEDISREDIANHAKLNSDYLARMFKKETGLNITEYVLQERVNIAKEMLAKTDLTVGSIAASVGYNNFSHFSKMFKKTTAINPKDYRRLYRL